MRKIPSADICAFITQLAALIASGLPVNQALNLIIYAQPKTQLKPVLQDMKHDIESGLSLADSFCKYPESFSALDCQLINAGEKAGMLESMLQELARYKEKMQRLRQKILKALSYPLMVLIIALIICGGLVLYVVPQFASLYRNFNAPLPALTNNIIVIAEFLQAHGVLLLSALPLLWYCGHLIKNNGSSRLESILFSLPILGNLLQNAATARFLTTLSICCNGGLSLFDALKLVGLATNSLIYAQACGQIRNAIGQGQALSAAIRHSRVFPIFAVQMLHVAEESGTLEKNLAQLAGFYERMLDNELEVLSGLIEPVIISILGIFVGTLVIALYLPIFKLGTAL